MRPVVIFLLIVTHSFTMYTGGVWPLPDGIHKVWAYDKITHVAFSFMLETFVFISGYLFGIQQQRKHTPFLTFCLKKVQRLIVPGIVFSIVYIACFSSKDFISKGLILKILNGAGHLWFLPMLFWCFIIAYLINIVKGHNNVKLVICIMLSLCSGLLPLPFRISNACYYILFFYWGMYIYPRRQKIIDRLNMSNIILLIATFIVSYIAFSHIKHVLSECGMSTLIGKLLCAIGIKMCTIVYSSMGLIMLFAISNYALKRKHEWQCPPWLVSINAICFGIYIYQQFILKFLYYKTPLPQWAGTYFLPWMGCIVTIVTSMILAKLTVQTKLGRKLIG